MVTRIAGRLKCRVCRPNMMTICLIWAVLQLLLFVKVSFSETINTEMLLSAAGWDCVCTVIPCKWAGCWKKTIQLSTHGLGKMKVRESHNCSCWEELDPSGDWSEVDLCYYVVQELDLDYRWEDVGGYSHVGAPCGKRCFMNANFVCGKPFDHSLAFIAGRLGWRTNVMNTQGDRGRVD